MFCNVVTIVATWKCGQGYRIEVAKAYLVPVRNDDMNNKLAIACICLYVHVSITINFFGRYLAYNYFFVKTMK